MTAFHAPLLVPRIETTVLSFASQAVDVTVGCQNPSEPLHLKVGDTGPALTFRLKVSETGGAYSLVGWSSIVVDWLRGGQTTKTVDGGACTITSAAGGIVTYTLGASDTATAGDYLLVLRGTDPDGKARSLPLRGYIPLTVHPAL